MKQWTHLSINEIPEEIRNHQQYANNIYWLEWAGICGDYVLMVLCPDGQYENKQRHRWKKIELNWELEIEEEWQGASWQKFTTHFQSG